ncbi:uncharacterized protein LOC123317323 isoform X2 [Coccinella septempunctata]|uniref:uncharacterized protein LOC123317323 isoform X2 n=1 Tax=Coccinella septempunctata TaxID=41139 RepID=UPI001D07B05D|nr:uncharacterized protein LOC123317323 isoform X2 [Coccinella septempunctata]
MQQMEPNYKQSPKFNSITMSLKNKDHEKQMQDNMRGRTLLLVFLRMSSKRKMDLLTKFFQLIRNLQTLADILNIFFSVNTKLISYSKIATDSNALYEQFIKDDDRMLDHDALEESLLDNTEWFTNLEDASQMNIITSLMRLSGGSIIKKMYTRLIKIFNRRNAERNQEFREYKSSSSLIFSDTCEELIYVPDIQPRYVHQDEESDYNQDCPTNKKVVEARKQWQASMAKLRKEIEIEVQRLNEPILQKIKEKEAFKQLNITKLKDSSNPKDNDRVKKTSKIQETDIDWVQFLPVWNVKKIFSYLDEKTLQNLKNVNNYWATISKEVLAEIKARENLDATIKKTEEFLDNLLDNPQTGSELVIRKTDLVTEPSGYRKRIEKQRRTGTSIRRKQIDFGNLQNKSALCECFKEFDTQNVTFLTKLKSFPTGIITKLLEYDGEKSMNVSEVASVHVIKPKPTTETKVPSESEMDQVSSASSVMSLVPSIVVSTENMETW